MVNLRKLLRSNAYPSHEFNFQQYNNSKQEHFDDSTGDGTLTKFTAKAQS